MTDSRYLSKQIFVITWHPTWIKPKQDTCQKYENNQFRLSWVFSNKFVTWHSEVPHNKWRIVSERSKNVVIGACKGNISKVFLFKWWNIWYFNSFHIVLNGRKVFCYPVRRRKIEVSYKSLPLQITIKLLALFVLFCDIPESHCLIFQFLCSLKLYS